MDNYLLIKEEQLENKKKDYKHKFLWTKNTNNEIREIISFF